MRQWHFGLVAMAILAGSVAGCGTAEAPPDAATPADVGIDGPPIADVGTGHDGGLGVDAARPDAARGDAGMCVDLPPDPNREVAYACSACRPPTTTSSTNGTCHTDADCNDATMGSNGRCVYGRIGPHCDYDTCFADADCASNEACLCDGSDGGGNTCVPASCHVNADCTGGLDCSPTFGSCGLYSGYVGYRCHTATDTCTTDADCTGVGAYCAYDETSAHWACSSTQCAG